MAKMFYTTEEAAQKLSVSGDQLKTLVSENKLREFRDGARVMFKVDQVDKLASDRKSGTSSGTRAGSSIGLADSGIGLSDSHGTDVISLADTGASPSKEDTVVTGAAKSKSGQQVLRPGDVKNPADTGAQTQIQSAIDDQLSLEGVGSGSGLLDLTRESDDTSLGAELLDEIYPGGDSKSSESGIGSASGIFEQASGGSSVSETPSGLDNMASTPTPVAVIEAMEVSDPSSGAFGGLALASVIISLATLLIALCFFQGFTPEWVGWLTDSGAGMTNILIFGAGLAVVSALLAGFGYVIGKSTR